MENCSDSTADTAAVINSVTDWLAVTDKVPWEKSSVRQLYITLLRSFWYWATLEGDIWNIKANQIFYFHPMHLCQCVRWLFSASPGNCSWNRAASLSLVMSNLSQANSEKSYSGPSSEASVFSNSQWPTYDVWLISFTTLCVVFSTYECVFNNSTAIRLCLTWQLSRVWYCPSNCPITAGQM